MKRILIVKLSSLGDIIHLSWILPAIKSRYPDCSIDWAVNACYQKFLELFVEVDRVISFQLERLPKNVLSWTCRSVRDLHSLRRQNYDAIIDAQGLFKSGIITFWGKSQTKIGFSPPEAREGSHRFYHHKCRIDNEINVLDKYLLLFKKIGIDGFVPRRPDLSLTRADASRVNRFLRNLNFKYKIIFNPSASFYTKFFPMELLPSLAERVRKIFSSPLLVLNDGTKEKFCHLSHPDILFSPHFHLEELPIYLRQCDFMIGVDSGPSYIAELVGTPSLILFGPTNLRRQSPGQSRDPSLQEIFNPGGKPKHLSSYSHYACPIIKPGEITTPYRCLNRQCGDNLCMQFSVHNIVTQVQGVLEGLSAKTG